MHTFFSFEKNVSYIEFAFHSKNPQINYTVKLGVSKKTEKPIKPRKPEKNNRINRTVKINRLKFKKKPTCLVRFRFYKPETEKTEPNRTELKPKKTGKNRAKTESN
jgi:hypothetical protein